MTKLNLLSRQALNAAKNELDEADSIILDFSKQRDFELDQIDSDFFSFVLKKTYFIKETSKAFPDIELFDQLISDLFDVIRYAASRDYRPYYLSVRSFSENFVRLLENQPLSANHITLSVLEQFKNDYAQILSKGDGYPFLRSEYRISSTIIHYHKIRPTRSDFQTITRRLQTILLNPIVNPNKRGRLYERFIRLYKMMELCYISKFPEQIYMSFFRRTILLEWLIGEKHFEILSANSK